MSLFENLFNSMALFIFTLPISIIVGTAIFQYLTKKRLLAISIVFIIQVILYYGYSCIILNIKIPDVYLDYVGYVAIYTLIFGFIGTFIVCPISIHKKKLT